MGNNAFESLDKREMIILNLAQKDLFEKIESVSIDDEVGILEGKKDDDVLVKLQDEDLITGNGDKEGKKKYCLTDKGKEKGEKIWQEIKDESITLMDNDDTIELKLKNVSSVLKERSIIDIINQIDENNDLDVRTESFKSGKLVGRDDVLKRLEQILNETKSGKGNTVFILGDTGVGKTRLAYEIKRTAHKKDINFLKGDSSIEDYNPYRPFKNALKKFIIIGGDDELGNIISVADPIISDSKTKEMFDAQRKSVFYDATKYVEKLCNYRPLVIFLDDLQWADKGTLNLLEYMADKLQDKPVLFIGNFRPGDVSDKHPLKEIMNRMSRKKLYEKIELDPLDKENIEKLIKEITKIENVPLEFISNMKRKTKGNPLFIEESLDQMIDEGLINQEKSYFPEESDIVLTSGLVQDVISRRINNFDDQTRKILQIGSVIGKKIPFDLLVEASDIDELELLEYIDSLMDSDLWIEHQDEDFFVFKHDLFVDTIYDGLGEWLERKNHHEKVAESMENLYDDLTDKYSKLAYHYKNAEFYDRACEFYYKAGERAEKLYAHEDAIERYKESIKLANLAQNIEEPPMFKIMERLSDAFKLVGKYDHARKYLKQTITKSEDIEDQRRIYRKISKTWLNQGEYENAIETIERGLSLSDGDKDIIQEDECEMTPEVCRLLSKKGWVMMRMGRYDETNRIFKRELEIAKEIDHEPSLSQAYHNLGTPTRSNIENKKSIEYLNKSIEIRDKLIQNRDEIEDKIRKSSTLNNLAGVYMRRGELDNALSLLKESIEIDNEIHLKLEKGRSLNNIGYIHILKGLLDDATKYLEEAGKIAEKIGDIQGERWIIENQGLLFKEKGHFSKALDYFGKSLDVSRDINDRSGVFMNHKNMAQVYFLKGDLERAEENIEKADEIADETESHEFKIFTLIGKGRIDRLNAEEGKAIDKHQKALQLSKKNDKKRRIFESRYRLIEDYIAAGDLDEAEQNLKRAKEENIGVRDMTSKVKMLEGIIKKERGEFKRSEKMFEKSLDIVIDLSKQYRIARIYFEIGKLKGLQEKSKEAEKYLEKARSKFEEMDMNIFLRKCEKKLDEI